MREYFCAYHSMLDATRKLSDAEVGRLFRGLLQYSMTKEQPDNLQGREEIVFDIYSQQIDREIEKYQSACERNRRNGTTGGQWGPVGASGGQSPQNKDEGKDKGEDKDKGKGEEESDIRARTRFTPPTVEDVQAYASEKGWTAQDFSADRFVDFYASKGWKVGKNPMKDWKSAARGWVSRYRQEHPQEAPRVYKDADYENDW